MLYFWAEFQHWSFFMKWLACFFPLFQTVVKQPTTKHRPVVPSRLRAPQGKNKDKVQRARRQLQEKRNAREGNWEETQFFKPD